MTDCVPMCFLSSFYRFLVHVLSLSPRAFLPLVVLTSDAAAEKCGVVPNCLRLYGDGNELDPAATVEESNFFLLSHTLEYDTACSTEEA
jgi:hypothetical protein